MKRASRVIGKPVFSLSEGERLGTVDELVLNPLTNAVVGLVVLTPGFLRKREVVALADVHSLGADAVMLGSKSSLHRAEEVPEPLRSQAEQRVALLGKRLVTEGGRVLGEIVDILFDSSGRIVGYQLSSGLWRDLGTGRPFVPALPGPMHLGRDALIVPDRAADLVVPDLDGLTGAYRMLTREALAIEDEGVGYFARGRPAHFTVTDREGEVIVHQGEVITSLHLSLARETGRLPLLAEAAGVAEEARTWERLRAAPYHEVADYLEGKRAQSDVPDSRGGMVVREGATVTRADIEYARQQGRLRLLMASVLGAHMEQAEERAGTVPSS